MNKIGHLNDTAVVCTKNSTVEHMEACSYEPFNVKLILVKYVLHKKVDIFEQCKASLCCQLKSR